MEGVRTSQLSPESEIAVNEAAMKELLGALAPQPAPHLAPPPAPPTTAQTQAAEVADAAEAAKARRSARKRAEPSRYSTQTSLAYKRKLDEQAEGIASLAKFKKTAKVTSALGTKEEDIKSALDDLVKFNAKSVKDDWEKITGNRQELVLGRSLGYQLKSEKIRQIVERDAGSVKQGEILYQSDKIKKNEADPVECWGTGFPCAFNCVKSGINHEMEHVVSCTIQGIIGSLCQRDGLNRSQNSKGINSIHNVLLHRIMGILNLNPTIDRVYGIKNLMKYSQHCLGLPSIELFNQAKCSFNLIDVTFKFHSGTGFPTPMLETNMSWCKKIAELMISGNDPTIPPKQSKFNMGPCNSNTLNNVLSALYRGRNFGMCPKTSRWTNGYNDKQVQKAEEILDEIQGDPDKLSEIIKQNCDKVCYEYNKFMGGELNGRDGETGRICLAFSILLMRVIFTSTLKEMGPAGKINPPNNTPLNRLANKAKLYLENFDSNGVFEHLATRYGGVPMSGKNGIKFFEKNDNDRDYEEWARRQRGGGIPTMKENYSSPDDEPSEPGEFMKEIGIKEQSEVFRKHGEEKSAIEQDIKGIVEKEHITMEENKYMEEFLEDYNYLIKELKEIEDFMGEDFMISLFTCDLRMKRKKKPRTKKKKPSKKKPKKTVFGKKKKKKKVTPSKKKKAQKKEGKAGSKKQPKKKKQTKKKEKPKKQPEREIVIDLSGIRDLVSK